MKHQSMALSSSEWGTCSRSLYKITISRRRIEPILFALQDERSINRQPCLTEWTNENNKFTGYKDDNHHLMINLVTEIDSSGPTDIKQSSNPQTATINTNRSNITRSTLQKLLVAFLSQKMSRIERALPINAQKRQRDQLRSTSNKCQCTQWKRQIENYKVVALIQLCSDSHLPSCIKINHQRL